MASGKSFAFAGNVMTVLVSGEQTNGKFAALHVVKPSGSSTPLHRHAKETELSFVVSGKLSVESEGWVRRFIEGEFVVLPPMREHLLFNDSMETAQEFLICAPAVFDRFVAAVGVEVEEGSKPRAMTSLEQEALVKAAPEFGITIAAEAAPPGLGLEDRDQMFGPAKLSDATQATIAQQDQGGSDLVLRRVSMQPGQSTPFQTQHGPGCLFVIAGVVDLNLGDSARFGLKTCEAEFLRCHMELVVHNRYDTLAELLILTTHSVDSAEPV